MNRLSIDDVPEGNLVFCIEMDGRKVSQKSKEGSSFLFLASGVEIRRVLGLKFRDGQGRVRSIIVGESGQKDTVDWAIKAIHNVETRSEVTVTSTKKGCSVGDGFGSDWTAKAEAKDIIDFEIYAASPIMGENLKEYSRRLINAPGTKKSKLSVTFLVDHRASLDSRILAKTEGVIEEVEDETPPSSQVKVKGSKKKRVTKKDGRFKCKLCPYSTDHRPNLDRHQLTHSKKKAFSCKKCNQGFTLKQNRDKHQRKCTGAGTGVRSSIKELMENSCRSKSSRSTGTVPDLKGVYVTLAQKYKQEKEKVAVLEKENTKLKAENLKLKKEIEDLKGKSEPQEDESPGSKTEEEMDVEEF